MKRKTFKLFACAAILAMTLSFAACGGKSKTLEELYNDPTVSSMMDSAFGAMGGDGISVDYKATGNELAIECKFEDSSITAESVGDALGEALDQQADTFKEQVKSFDEAVGKEGACTVTVRYLDAEGNVITEKSYKAE